MPLLDLLNQYTPSKSPDNNQSVLENMYLEEDKSVSKVEGEYKVIALPTFGLSLFCDTLEATVRTVLEHNEILYVVAGNKFGSISSLGVFTQIGSNLTTSSGFAKINVITGSSDTNNQLVIIDGTNGYHYNIGTATATFPIADADFPQTASDMTTQDDYVIYEKAGSIVFGLSNVSDAKTYEALDFASKFRKPDRIVSIVSIKGEVWLIGSKTTEVWTNSGNVNFPFERRNDVFLEVGCAAKNSTVITANRLFFLGRNSAGGYGFVIIDNYQSKNVTTPQIMTKLNTLTTKTDCIGYSYAKDGHEFIDWVFPTDSLTITYDTTTGIFCTRSSNVGSQYGRFLGNCAAFCYDKCLVGDYNSGKIYSQSSSVYTENGTAIRRKWVSPPVYIEGKRIFISRLQIDVQTNVGSSKTFLLEMSLDRGTTWETIDTYTVPTDGSGTIYTTSLGSSRCFLFRITTTDNFNLTLLGFQAEAQVGDH